MKQFILTLSLLCGIAALQGHAQNIRFVNSGEIEFERSINTYAMLQRIAKQSDDNAWLPKILENFKQNQKQFKTLKSTLYFSDNKTLFLPVEDMSPPNPFLNTPELKQINTTFTDYNTRLQQTRKAVFEEYFLVKDTARTINWKITTETREIAGYTCRRANAIIMDSIYVVAFYTDRIPVSGGPENFNGLPGMILGVALPHDNVTWFAKTVTDKNVEPKLLVPPAKGKVTDNKGLKSTLLSALKDWGNYASSFMKSFML